MQASRILAGAAVMVALLLLALYTRNSAPDPVETHASATALAETQQQKAGAPVPTETLQIITAAGTHTIKIEVARTPDQQARGLMFRTSLADDHGMLFPHDEPRELSMWMRNTYISLDMVFIRPDGVIHRIAERTEPLSDKVVSSNGDVSAVLELAAGSADRLGLKPGDRVEHQIFQTSR
jgi:uncharacterized membrane protein (UPF0127 family)